MYKTSLMKNVILMVAILLATEAQAQKLFKDSLSVNGVTYKATYNSPEKVMYIQQDYFDFTLAADSFSIQVMNEIQWTAYKDVLVAEGAFFRNGLYHLPNDEQVFKTTKQDEYLDGTYVYHLFGSVDTGQ